MYENIIWSFQLVNLVSSFSLNNFGKAMRQMIQLPNIWYLLWNNCITTILNLKYDLISLWCMMSIESSRLILPTKNLFKNLKSQ